MPVAVVIISTQGGDEVKTITRRKSRLLLLLALTMLMTIALVPTGLLSNEEKRKWCIFFGTESAERDGTIIAKLKLKTNKGEEDFDLDINVEEGWSPKDKADSYFFQVLQHKAL